MKKTTKIIALAVIALGVGIAFAPNTAFAHPGHSIQPRRHPVAIKHRPQPRPQPDMFGIPKANIIIPEVFEAYAETLNISTSTLKSKLQNKEKMEDIIKSYGYTNSSFRDNVRVKIKAHLDQLVTDKKITTAESDKAYLIIAKHLDAYHWIFILPPFIIK